ncbi:MAG: hypothetical protein M1832_003429 [Thelocarpon impressellum]|nr:MAG: hypothetical protein M1832_003429 [Thelocarpon impressellum]
MSPPEQQFLLQVRFIQDRSSGSGLFNETTPTFLNFAKWARASQKPKDEVPVPGEDWEVFGDITRAAHFQDHTGWIWYSGWPNASAAGAAATTVKTRSARMLIANLTSGKLVLGSDEFTTSRWAFTPTGDYLVLRNGTDPKMRLCRSADGVQASSPGARPENFGAQPGSVGVKARNALAQAEMPVAASRQGAPTNMQNTPTANQVLPTANQNAPATNPDTLPVSVQADGPATAGQFTILLGDAAVAAGMRCQNIRLQRQVATNTSQPVTDLSTFRAGGTPNPSS